MASKIIRKTLEEAQHVQNAEIDFSDKNLIHLEEMPRLWTMKNVTRLTLSHNKITEIPAALVKNCIKNSFIWLFLFSIDCHVPRLSFVWIIFIDQLNVHLFLMINNL